MEHDIATIVVPATSGYLRFGAKVGPRGRWLPDTGTLTRQRQYSVVFFRGLSRYKDEDGVLPSNEYMGCACRGVHPYTVHANILTHTVILCIQSIEYHKTPLLKYIVNL